MKRQPLRWAVVLAWMALIFFLSAQSHLPDLTPSAPGLEEIGGHLSAYFVLALLLRWTIAGAGVRHATWWAIGLCALYGISDEFHQGFVPNRDPSLEDWLRDVLGASAAMLLTSLLAGIRSRSRSRSR